ncbi:MAG TPA: polysaccharide lyase 6 family protein [Chitinophagaceae bacterium]
MKMISRLLLIIVFPSLFIAESIATEIPVKDISELNKANAQAKPGDVIILQNGEWKDVRIALSCSGTSDKPITFKAQNAGKVLITGLSFLKLGGNYIIVDGLYFTRGYAGNDAVIDFRINKNQLANNCRVTNCVVDDFNNPRRMDENYWVSFYGRNNRLDHCNFVNKKNIGVLLAVILDDDRSRENFHSIDHNYFGLRIPLASNGGEIIRVGVSQHCQFNSNTSITDNFFEKCDGETEIVSIKSGSNVVKNNVFKECQGSVVLRHGDNNTVANNIFLGNNKEGTGGVRVINRGQWVVNNLFYQCRGVDFRSPLAIMNGVPNSPAHRYVQVTESVIANNTFYECAPVTFCEGSDKERSVPPAHVFVLNNIFYNEKDSVIYKVYDDISGFTIAGNNVSRPAKQKVGKGFERSLFSTQKSNPIVIPATITNSTTLISDSLQEAAKKRLGRTLPAKPGFANLKLALDIYKNATSLSGSGWIAKAGMGILENYVVADCANAEEINKVLAGNRPAIIRLISTSYHLDKPFAIGNNVTIRSNANRLINLSSEKLQSAFIIQGNGKLKLEGLNITANGIQAMNFISNDTSGKSDHYNLVIEKCKIENLKASAGCRSLFYAYKSMVADSIVLRGNIFLNNQVDVIVMNEEKDDKGYYNAERIVLENNSFQNGQGGLLNVYRGGNDESTLGPQLFVSKNNFSDYNGDSSFISLTGVQKTQITNNTFRNCFKGKPLIAYKDIVRADHLLQKNIFSGSGEVRKNKFVRERSN